MPARGPGRHRHHRCRTRRPARGLLLLPLPLRLELPLTLLLGQTLPLPLGRLLLVQAGDLALERLVVGRDLLLLALDVSHEALELGRLALALRAHVLEVVAMLLGSVPRLVSGDDRLLGLDLELADAHVDGVEPGLGVALLGRGVLQLVEHLGLRAHRDVVGHGPLGELLR